VKVEVKADRVIQADLGGRKWISHSEPGKERGGAKAHEQKDRRGDLWMKRIRGTAEDGKEGTVNNNEMPSGLGMSE